MKILAFTNQTSSYLWRFEPVGIRMMEDETCPHELLIADIEDWENTIYGADVVVLQLVRGANIVDTIHNLGKKVIYEADDAMLDTYGKERKNLTDMDPRHRTSTMQTIQKVDALTVTSHELAKNYARFTNAPIYVLPIYFDWKLYEQALAMNKPERNSDEVRIGWFGSQGHHEDLKMVEPALAKVLDKYPEAKFVYCGYGGASGDSDKLMTKVGWGEDAFDKIPSHRREYVIGVRPRFWPQKHRTLDLDIGICPLIEDEFNRCKVATKWFEYSAFETPTVCSPTVYGDNPYGSGKPTVQHGKNGFIAKTEDDWVKYLSMLVEDAKLRRKIGKQARYDVETKWNIENHWQDWIDVYQEVLNS